MAVIKGFTTRDIERYINLLVDKHKDDFNPYLGVYEEWIKNCGEHDGSMTARGILTKKYSWAIPNMEALRCIAEYSPILEVGAGTGYWASLLSKMNVTIRAVDNRPPLRLRPNLYGHKEQHFKVVRGNYGEVYDWPKSTLFLCWPPGCSSAVSSECLYAYHGKILLYVGEYANGCTGDNVFHDTLAKDWVRIHQQAIPRWFGMCDSLFVYRRKIRS